MANSFEQRHYRATDRHKLRGDDYMLIMLNCNIVSVLDVHFFVVIFMNVFSSMHQIGFCFFLFFFLFKVSFTAFIRVLAVFGFSLCIFVCICTCVW